MASEVWIWLILGGVLILSEFFMTGVIAVFFGLGALLTALAVQLGLVSTLPAQIALFAVMSLASLVLVRDKLKTWFQGHVSDQSFGNSDLISARGNRVTVIRAFSHGVGTVRLSGTEWNAEAVDPDASYEAGRTLWIVGHRGITLQVTDERPAEQS